MPTERNFQRMAETGSAFADDAAGIADLIKDAMENHEELPRGTRARLYCETGILTRDEGLVLRLPNGAEFQITVVQSKRGA